MYNLLIADNVRRKSNHLCQLQLVTSIPWYTPLLYIFFS